MSVFKSDKNACITYKRAKVNISENEDIRRQLNKVFQAKRQIRMKLDHWTRIKRITKDPKELAEIERTLQRLSKEFLEFSVENF
ncbi:hypothetical protein [Perigonia lusca single nucleopolyhedrovirus]|uniref:Uncharacterized protein n=1 Tax=Perigonia lusca single nucleopolyhedrovirus TaxID=1675865 RepID=A0A0M3WNI3_9ABAC|nr:hypothetical protein [Perigonia lusca single nucleopolyhedrovirus]AKN80566.1 hypothetical protein [Perigonia lusca single nucleopolyhedrovirus]